MSVTDTISRRLGAYAKGITTMRVFVTGASGFIGSVIVRNLLKSGHEVVGLARSTASAKAVLEAGGKVLEGDVEDLDVLKNGAAESDGVIHTAFIHDFARFKEVCEADRRAIEALGTPLVGSKRPLIVTSGTVILKPGGVKTENEPALPSEIVPRSASEEAAMSLAERGVHTSIVRLPPMVHDRTKAGFASVLTQIAVEKKVSAYVGDGQNRWPAVHVEDAALVYTAALEKAAHGAHYHAVGEEGLRIKDIASTLAKKLGVPTASLRADEAAAQFGFLSAFIGADVPASSAWTQQQLKWTPKHAGLLSDLA